MNIWSLEFSFILIFETENWSIFKQFFLLLSEERIIILFQKEENWVYTTRIQNEEILIRGKISVKISKFIWKNSLFAFCGIQKQRFVNYCFNLERLLVPKTKLSSKSTGDLFVCWSFYIANKWESANDFFLLVGVVAWNVMFLHVKAYFTNL